MSRSCCSSCASSSSPWTASTSPPSASSRAPPDRMGHDAGRSRAAVRGRALRAHDRAPSPSARPPTGSGRRAILAPTVLFFGVASLASALAPPIGLLTLLRFVTGLGLGGGPAQRDHPRPRNIARRAAAPSSCRSWLSAQLRRRARRPRRRGVGAHLIAAYGYAPGPGARRGPTAPAGPRSSGDPAGIRPLPGDAGFRDARVAATLRRIIPDTVIPAGSCFVGRSVCLGGPCGGRALPPRCCWLGTLFLWLTFFMSLLVFYGSG